MIFFLLTLSAIFRAIQEHAKWKNDKDLSIFHGTWFLKTDGFLNLDGYHICSFLHIFFFALAGYIFDYPIWSIPIFTHLFFYQIFNLFYHILFNPKFWRFEL